MIAKAPQAGSAWPARLAEGAGTTAADRRESLGRDPRTLPSDFTAPPGHYRGMTKRSRADDEVPGQRGRGHALVPRGAQYRRPEQDWPDDCPHDPECSPMAIAHTAFYAGPVG